MKNIVSFLLLFVCCTAFAQTRSVEITNIESGKVKLFEQDQRVKVRTVDRKKLVGNLQFVDAGTIMVEGTPVKIDSILSIKNQPKVLGTVKTVVLVTGLVLVGGSIVAATAGNNVAFLLFASGAGVTIGAGVIEALNTNHSNRKWHFNIIEK